MTFHPAIEFYQRYGEPSPKTEELAKLFVRAANGAYGSAEYVELLRSIDERQKTLAAFGGTFHAELKARLVIGMSQGRLWGNGFQFHPVYGIPYLPASGIKGALRHFLAEEGQATFTAAAFEISERTHDPNQRSRRSPRGINKVLDGADRNGQ